MLEFTWKVFADTGNIDTYLLFKELERERQGELQNSDEEHSEIDFPIT
ncbi:YqzL family protein [Heyndrickxia ginsengihumi]|uniref:YqzL family protein n=1 Tax=Heyndrickxia ginsengihumi TaxID=363870 RepID=A0A6M0P4R1_9BACI|nr:YqzL family protein [Heyndrickxia ginsengihumi]MBE6183955.1 YqzL family protein [Bacillus sp. (in: firmicutes)]MCM3021761.1 YqzL family protein [Heyndrickxia ginsengihumi]NEY19694.1 YqzL family protein [Heyndrickxia ginsengihumi]